MLYQEKNLGESTENYVDSEVAPGSSTTQQQKSLQQSKKSVKKEILLPHETKNINKIVKGKGIGNKTKRKASTSMDQENNTREENVIIIDNIDINERILDMPVYFQDDLECGGEVTIENCSLHLIVNPTEAAKNVSKCSK